MRLIYFFIIQSVYSFGSLVGNRYFCKFSVPFISTSQNINVIFTTDNEATVQLDGFINKLGNVCYTLDENQLIFELDSEIIDIMDKYCIVFNETSYDENTDSHTIIIKSSILPFSKTINLERM